MQAYTTTNPQNAVLPTHSLAPSPTDLTLPTPPARQLARYAFSMPTPTVQQHRELRKVESTPALRQKPIDVAITPRDELAVARAVKFSTPSAVRHRPASATHPHTANGCEAAEVPPATHILSDCGNDGRYSRRTLEASLYAPPSKPRLMGWETPPTMVCGMDGIVRRKRTPLHDLTSPMTQSLLRFEAVLASRGPSSSQEVRKPRTLSRLEVGATPFGMPRWEPSVPVAPQGPRSNKVVGRRTPG